MTVVVPELWPQRRKRRYTRERENYLRANPELAVAILVELKMSERFVGDLPGKLGQNGCLNGFVRDHTAYRHEPTDRLISALGRSDPDVTVLKRADISPCP